MPLGKGHRLNGVVKALEETPAAFTTPFILHSAWEA
jgi:hypothetical protein